MNSETTKDYLKSILLTESELFREYWDMWVNQYSETFG